MPNIDHIALNAVHAIEDELMKPHIGGRAQRNARMQTIIIEAIKTAMNLACRNLMEFAPASVSSPSLHKANRDPSGQEEGV